MNKLKNKSQNEPTNREKRGQVVQQLAEAYREAAPFLNIGWFFVIAVLLGIWVGNYFDDLYSIRPLFTLTGAITGILLGFLNLYKTIAFLKKKK